MALAVRTFSWRPNPDGTVDGHYPNGDKNPQVTALAWGDQSAFIAAVQQTATGSSLSANARAALTGTNAATATLTWVTASGSDVTATGFSVSGDNVQISSGTAGSGFARLGADDGTGVVYSAPIQWARIVVTTDTLAPTAPTGLIGTPGAGNITWVLDAASDPHDGTNAGAGVKEYDLELNGAITVVAGTAGITSAPTASNIGAISNPGAPTAIQSGRNWTLTCAGTGIDGTADQTLFLSWSVSGDCKVICKVASITGSGSNFAPVGLMIRESLAVGSKYVALYQWFVAQSQAIQGKQRLTTDGARSNLSTGAGTNTPRYLKLERVGNTFTLSYSTDGLAWTVLDSTTVSMGATVYIGAFANSLTAGSQIVGVVNDLNVSTAAQVSYTQTTASATTARVRARDLQTPTPNVGSYSALTASVTPLASVPPVKWDPGYYVFESNFGTYNATRLTEILGMANCKGYKIRINWKDVETSRGIYSWAFLDGLLNQCAAAGKRLIIEIYSNNFSGTNPLPAYLATEPNAGGGWYVKTSPLAGYQAKVYLAAVMDRIIALAQAASTQYDAHSKVAAIILLAESSLPQVTAQSDYTESGYLAQMLRFITEAKPLFLKTPVFIGANFGFQTRTNWVTVLDALAQNGCGYNGPDIYTSNPDHSTDADRTARGLLYNGSAFVAGGIDYRGTIPISHDAQSPELGGKENSGSGQTLATLYTQVSGVNKSNFVSFLYKDYTSAPTPPNDIYLDHTQGYATNPVVGSQDIKTFISGGASPVVTTAPSVYASVVTGG